MQPIPSEAVILHGDDGKLGTDFECQRPERAFL
jgi:hypothetical protein